MPVVRLLTATSVTALSAALVTAAALTPARAAAVAAPAAPASRSAAARDAATVRPTTVDAVVRRFGTVHERAGRTGPSGPDPALALVRDQDALDWAGWRREQASAANHRANAVRGSAARQGPAAASGPVPRPVVVREREAAGRRGANDTSATAERIAALRTGRAPVTVTGRLSPAPEPALVPVPPSTEDDGTFATARDLGLSPARPGISTTGTIGDHHPDNPRRTDADVYAVTLRAGQLFEATLTRTSGDLAPDLLLLTREGDLAAAGEGYETKSPRSTLTYQTRTAATYYLVAYGISTVYTNDTPDKITTGAYALSAGVRAGDRDLFRVSLTAGDVLGASLTGAAGYVSVLDGAGRELHGSARDASGAYPATSPLPGGGNAVTDHVVARSGMYDVEVSGGTGAYAAALEVYRFGGAARRQTQTIYLDTDGERLNTNVVGGRGVATLSPLGSFLKAWGLRPTQERAVVQRMRTTVQEKLDADLRASGLSGTVSVKVVTRYEGPDPFGRPGVTRLVVGGTTAQAGIDTIGIAQSVDPGNFAREETGLLLLDALSTTAKDEAPYSLTTYLTPRSDRVGFVGRVLGTIASHEVGHMLGNWHVDETNATANLMDAGGSFAQFFGVGADGVGGTRDDRSVDFGLDVFRGAEGFTGTEDTLARSTWAMSTRAR